MTTRPTFRSFSWSAYHCNYSEAEVYIGLAPGLEDISLRRMFGDELLRKFPGRDIPITDSAGAPREVPLRLYALRDAAMCDVESLGAAGGVEGFHRVKLHFKPPKRADDHPAKDASAHSPEETPKVIAFLITLGLTREQEEHFFTDIVGEFLDHSWSSLPKLLREVGCAEPSTA